jgi:small-conductance mechanosensitive channel
LRFASRRTILVSCLAHERPEKEAPRKDAAEGSAMFGASRVLRAALAALFVAFLTVAALAQGPADYGALQAAAGEPTVEDYGRLGESFRGGMALDMTQREVDRFREAALATIRRLPMMQADVAAALRAASPSGEPAYFVALGALLLLLLGIGRAVATLFGVYVGRPVFFAMQRGRMETLGDKLPALAVRVGLTVIATVVTLATAALVASGFYPEGDRVSLGFAIVVFASYAAFRIGDTLWRMILAPFVREVRVPTMGDREARRLYRWLAVVTFLEIALAAAGVWLDSIGLQDRSSALVVILGSGLTTALLLWAATVNRGTVTGAILDGRPAREASWLARAAAALWLPALGGYLMVSGALLVWRAVMGVPIGPRPVVVSFVVVTAALVSYALLVFVAERLGRRRAAPPYQGPQPLALRDERADGAPDDGDGDDGDGDGDEGGARVAAVATPTPPPAGMRTFLDLARRVASLLALGAGFWALAIIWGGREAFADGAPLDRVQDVLDILFLSYLIYHALRIWIDQRIEAEGGDELDLEPGDEGGASASSRLATLLPLVRNFVLALVVTAAALVVATELGVNVAPLLGGAGIIGLAIGFGSQALVRDILSGAFFLFDDAFRKGEYIDIGGVKGTVERISLRSFQLRHHLGALHTVPFGEIKHLTNFSRDWVMMKLPLRLTYDTDPEKVRKIVKNIGIELLDHPEEGRKFMQPLKSQGVFMMEDSAMIIRVKYMTRPGDQWTTRKLVYQRIREAFAENGIRFAHREVTVRIPELEGDRERGLSAGEMRAIGAAARRVVDDVDAEAALRPTVMADDR